MEKEQDIDLYKEIMSSTQEETVSSQPTPTEVSTEEPEVDLYKSIMGDAQEEPETSTEEPEVDLYKSIMGDAQEEPETSNDIKQIKQLAKKPTKPNESDEVTYKELSNDTEYMKMLREYQTDRFGEKQGKQREGESNEDYLRRFVSHVREFEFNSIDLGQQLDWIRTAKDDKKAQFGYLYSQLDKLPSFYEEGVGSTVAAIRDYGAALFTDPLTYLGFGAGSVAKVAAVRAVGQALKQYGKQAAIKEASKYGFKNILKTTPGRIVAGGIAAETGAAVVQDLKLQNLEQEAKLRNEKSYLQAGLVGTLGAALGTGGAYLSKGIDSTSLFRGAQNRLEKQKVVLKELTEREAGFEKEAGKRAAEAVKAGEDSATGIFDKVAGREVLDQLGEIKPEASLKAQITYRTELMQRVGKVATDIAEELALDGTLRKIVDVDTKASEVIGKITTEAFEKIKDPTIKRTNRELVKELQEETKGMLEKSSSVLEDVDASVFEAAISRAGLTTKQFVDAMGTTYMDAARVLQSSSNMGKLLAKLRQTDKELADSLINVSDTGKVITPLSKAHEIMMRVDRNRRALMVTQLATTIRNLATGGVRLTMETASDAIESTLYQFGKGLDGATSGEIGSSIEGGLRNGISNVFRDSFGALNRLRQVVDSADLTDALLKHNTSLASKMNRSLQEVTDKQSLWWVSEKLNGLNIAQDLLFRRAIFTNTIDKRLRRAGIIVNDPKKVGQFKSLEEFVASGRALPTKLLDEAVQESLGFTFAKTPKVGKGKASTIGYHFIKGNEMIGPVPIGIAGTATFPFARFMVNAIEFQYKYSPLSLINSGATGAKYGFNKIVDRLSKESKRVDAMKESGELMKAREDFSKGVVGSAALIAAIKYRADNQDVKWYEYKTQDGTTGDLRPFFPLAPYLALGDLLVKLANDDMEKFNGKDFLEGITGAQFRTGASSFVLDNAFDVFRGETTVNAAKISQKAGEFFGELFAGFTTPARMLRDVQAAYDTEASYIRDSGQIQGLAMDERFYEGLVNKIQKDMPEFSKDLPVLQSPTRTQPIVRSSPLVGQFTGFRSESKRSAAETELVRLGIPNYKVIPSTGDKEVDSAVRKFASQYIEEHLNERVKSKSFSRLNDTEKKTVIMQDLKFFRKISKSLAKNDFDLKNLKGYTPFDRMQYIKLSSNRKRLAEQWYKNRYNKSVFDMQREEPDYNHVRNAINIAKAKESALQRGLY